tara:strand:- start:101 stop:370 length:270 start_codon:yes stop_codon:yes gene_type:complete
MITQYQIRKYSRVSDTEKYDFIDQMIESLKKSQKELKDKLVDQGLAHYELKEGRELAPTKEMYILKHGVDDWNKIKRIGKPSEKFIKHW